MGAIHNKNNFLFPVKPTDVEVFTKDVNNNSTNAISPESVVFLQAVGTDIVIKTRGTDNILSITFSTPQEAIQALVLLKTALNLVSANSAIPGGPIFYHWIQSIPSTEWIFAHNLGKMTAVSVMDNNFNEMLGEVVYIDVNTVSIYFNTAVSGHAWI